MSRALIALALFGCAAGEPLAPVPELARAIDVDPDPATVEVHLEAGPAELEIVPATITPGLAYHDRSASRSRSIAGPLIEVEVGQTLTVWLENAMERMETSLHFHGMRTPASLDANPIVDWPIEPGRTRLHRFTVADPGLYWIHPHVHDDRQIELGLQAIVLVRAPAERRAGRERVWVLDDVDLTADGAIAIEPDHDDHHLGRSGAQLLVNGRAPGRIAAIAGAVERWRFVNTANGRHFALALAGHAFEVIGWDGPPLEAPYETELLEIAPGERRDVLVRLAGEPGSSIWLETRAVDRGAGMGEWAPARLARIDLERGDPGPIVRASDFARPVEPLPIDGARRSIVLEADLHDPRGPVMTINGEGWPFGDPIEARLGEVEVWEITSASDVRHPLHVHGTFFQVIDRDGIPEPVRGWRDTVAIGPLERLRIAVRYDTPGRWMYHCQIPEHAHMGMMADFIVSE